MLTLLGRRWRTKTFDNFELSPGTREAYEACKGWAERWTDEANGLLLVGNKGTGKTHLLAAIANQTGLDNICWLDITEFLESLQPDSLYDQSRKRALECWGTCFGACGTMRYEGSEGPNCWACPGRNGDPVQQAMRAKVLVMDDLGVRRNNDQSDWVHSKLYPIINYRYEEELPILASSNYGPQELGERLGHDRLISRLLEMCKIHGLRGEDYRIRAS